MALNLSNIYEEDERLRKLSAGQASLPMYGAMQAQGAGALGDIFGIDTGVIDEFGRRQEGILSQFQPKYPERLLQSEKPFEWWKEKAALNSMNTIAPMLGFAIGNTMQAMPHWAAKIAGKTINWATYALTYNANFADTLQEHEDAVGRELTASEKAKAALVASGVTYLDMIAPIKGATATSRMITKTFGKGGLDATRKSLQKLVKTNRQGLRQQLSKGSVHLGKLIGIEMGTEASQKAIQIATSATPGRLGTSEGMQDILEEAVIAGPVVGGIGAPGAVGVAREQNRDISTARRLAKGFNRQVMEGESPTSSTEADLIDIPELTTPIRKLAEQGNQLAKKVTGVDFKEAAKSAVKGIAFKPLSDLIKIRNEAKTGAEFHAANNAYQRFAPTGTASGETQVQENFFSIKETKTGQYLKPIINVLNKYANKKRFIGFIGQDINPEISKYIIQSLKGEKITAKPPKEFIAEFNVKQPKSKSNPEGLSDLAQIKAQRDVVFKDLTAAGLDIGYIENYLTNPISAEAVKNNREGFIKALIASSVRANKENPKVHVITREGVAAKDGLKARKGAEQIADDIINNIDPDILTAREEEALNKSEFKGQGRRGWEKSRAAAWKYLDEESAKEGLNFREQNIERILTGYMQKAATRVASVSAFGENASKLREDLKVLREAKKEDGTPVLSKEQRDKVYDVYDAAHNTYKRNTNKNWSAVSKMATTVGAVTHLGLATISSFTELAWIGERAGFGNMLRTLPKALAYTLKGIHRGVSGKYREPSEGAQAMATLGFNLDPRVNERLDQIFSTDHNMVVNMYFRTFAGGFLTQWTNFNRNWAAQAMMTNINRRANSIIRGDLSDIERRRLVNELKENGVSNDEFQFISKAFTNEQGKVRVDITNEGILNTKMPNGKTVRDVLVPWLHKVVDDVVVHPKAINKPLWMSDPRFAIIAQLKTFPVVFGNTVVKRLLRKLNPKQCSPDFGAAIGVVQGLAMAYALVHIGETMKAAIRQTDFEAPGMRETLDRAGLTGAVGLLGGAGRFQEGATTSMIGVGAGFVDRAWEEFISPLYTEQDISAFGNMTDWFAESVDAALGAAGIGFKPTQSLFNVEDD
jgi:hypothetical protein